MKTRIVWMSDDVYWGTGFGSQSLRVLSKIKKAHPTWELGAYHPNYRGVWFPSGHGITLLPDQGQGHWVNARWYIDHFKPDVFVTLWDIFVSGFMGSPCQTERGSFRGLCKKGGYSETKWISWFVYDMLRWSSPRIWSNSLSVCDAPVAMSRFGQESVQENYGVKPHMIYHGVSPKSFPALEKDRIQERRMKMGNPDFIMGALFRNIKRKQPVRLLEAWANVSREYPDVKLLLNMRPDDREGADLALYLHHFNLISENPVKSPVIIGEQTNEVLGVPPDELNLYYQVCDAQVLPTQGEGFGIPIIEGYQANDLPVIMTACSTYPELVGDHGLPIEFENYEWTMQAGAMPIPSTESLEDAMRIMIDDRKLRTKFRQANHEFVKQFDFDRVIIPEWLKLLESVCPEPKEEQKPIEGPAIAS